ncbi:hypothetical protein AMECASPLE_009617 [Ameca splendens]|uniref:Uncharacterized protein n=1 Tax=Ameca splendens TaxID=208324 RepID=A0ABV0XP93_9TELE
MSLKYDEQTGKGDETDETLTIKIIEHLKIKTQGKLNMKPWQSHRPKARRMQKIMGSLTVENNENQRAYILRELWRITLETAALFKRQYGAAEAEGKQRD